MTQLTFTRNPAISAVQFTPFGNYGATASVLITLSGGLGTGTITPSGPDWCWIARDVGVDGATRAVAVPASGTVAFEGLTTLDPATFLTASAALTPAWIGSLTAEAATRAAADTAEATARAAITADTLPGATTVGKAVVKAVDATAARTAISAVGKGELVFNVMDYGAIGNGSADDTAAINAAITAANTARGGTVFLPQRHRITSSLTCSSVSDVALQGTCRSNLTGSSIIWAGADNGSTIKADNVTGFTVSGLFFYATSATFAGRHIDFSNTAQTMPQAVGVLIEGCFFGGGAGGVNNLHTDIETGSGHSFIIRCNNFYTHAIAIRGTDPTVTPLVGVNSCLVERNWFRGLAAITAHITNPGEGWKITCNAVESTTTGMPFVKLVPGGPSATTGTLCNVTIEDNWCGDATVTSVQIEIAGGPFTVRNNLFGVAGSGVALRAVGIVQYCHIEDNRVDGSGAAFIDWGAFTHGAVSSWSVGSGSIWVTGTQIPDSVPISIGTPPAKMVSDAGGGLSFPIGADLRNSIVQTGSGSPQGVITAPPGMFYVGVDSGVRTNVCPRPISSTVAATTGWVSAGSTLAVGSGYFRNTWTVTTGNRYMTTTVGSVAVTENTAYVFSVQARSSLARKVQCTLRFFTAGGVALGSLNIGATLVITDPTGFTNVPPIVATAPPTAAFATLIVNVDGTETTTVGETLDVRHVMLEAASAVGSYFDGATPAAGYATYAWTGTANASSSTATYAAHPAAYIKLTGTGSTGWVSLVPASASSVPDVATDATTTQTLVNALRTALINVGIVA